MGSETEVAKLTMREPARDAEAAYASILEALRGGSDADVEADLELFNRVRLGVAEGEIAPEDVELVSRDSRRLRMDRAGMLVDWPADVMNPIPVLQRILRAGVRLRAESRARRRDD